MIIVPHPDFDKIAARLKSIGKDFDIAMESDLFRFINPRFSKSADIVSGAGSWHAAGRWNLTKAAPLSYTALTPETALAEALAHARYFALPLANALPRVLVALRLKAGKLLDLRIGRVRRVMGLGEETIRKLDWRSANQGGVEALTQVWGRALGGAGFEGVVVPSAADLRGGNVLVFSGNLHPSSRFEVIEEVKWP